MIAQLPYIILGFLTVLVLIGIVYIDFDSINPIEDEDEGEYQYYSLLPIERNIEKEFVEACEWMSYNHHLVKDDFKNICINYKTKYQFIKN